MSAWTSFSAICSGSHGSAVVVAGAASWPLGAAGLSEPLAIRMNVGTAASWVVAAGDLLLQVVGWDAIARAGVTLFRSPGHPWRRAAAQPGIAR